MNFVEWADLKTGKLTVGDLVCVKWSCIAAGMLVSRLVPSVRRIDTRVLAAITIALAVKPAVAVLRARTPTR